VVIPAEVDLQQEQLDEVRNNTDVVCPSEIDDLQQNVDQDNMMIPKKTIRRSRRERKPVIETDSDSEVENISIRSRKRKRDVSTWIDGIRKRRRNAGKSYSSRSGKKVRERMMKAGCGSSCRLHCHERIMPFRREDIFHDYWKLGDVNRQRDYVHQCTKRMETKCIQRSGKTSRSNYSMYYYFTIEHISIQVCKSFFFRHWISLINFFTTCINCMKMVSTQTDVVNAEKAKLIKVQWTAYIVTSSRSILCPVITVARIRLNSTYPLS
jgi:hypothetical protein